MKEFYFFLIVWFANIFPVFADSLPFPLKKFDQYINRQVQEEKVIGCAVAVVSKGKIVFIKAYGVRKKGEKDPIDLDTVFQLGSASKPIAATLIALLQKQNLLSLGASISQYYPHVLPETTLQHLLSHTCGFSRTGWNYKIEAGQKRVQLLKLLAKSPQSAPGETFDYHNVVYSLIENVVENICHQPFHEVLKERLFRPLKMMRTSVGYHDFEQQDNRAWAHQENKKHRWYPSKQYSHRYHEEVCASAGMNSSIKDMARFIQLQTEGIPEILTLQDLSTFHNPIIAAPDAMPWFREVIPGEIRSSYGLGWRIIDCQHGRLICHGGWVKGFKSFIGFIPSRNIGIVILNNAESNFSLKTAMLFFGWWIKNKP